MSRPNQQRYERYNLANSPFAQNITQRDLANLLRTSKDRLKTLIKDKEKWTIRRELVIGAKTRSLVYPYGKLRRVHERIKYHLDKIKLPEYVYSPRRGRSQRDNAVYHLGQKCFLSLDIKQFYPSTSGEHIFRWAFHIMQLRADVAGLFTKLICIDNKIPLGSPVSAILTMLVHRSMFDKVHAACLRRGLKLSLWVDDLTISGDAIGGDLVEEVREIIRSSGLRSHKIEFKYGLRPTFITGLPIQNYSVRAPRSMHRRIERAYSELRQSTSDSERHSAATRTLSALGSYRYVVGAATLEGRRASNKMNFLRRRRALLDDACETVGANYFTEIVISSDPDDPPFGVDQVPSI